MFKAERVFVAVLVASLGSLVLPTDTRDACNFDDIALNKLCRKVESNNQYLDKMIETIHKTETVFRWYRSNKEWLGNSRLNQMMNRLLKRAAAAATTGVNSQGSEEDVSTPRSTTPSTTTTTPTAPTTPATLELETKLTQVLRELKETQMRLVVLEERNNDGGLPPWASHIDAALQNQKETVQMMANGTNQSLQLVVSQSEQLAQRLSETETMLQLLSTAPTNGCTCTGTDLAVREESSQSFPADLLKVKNELQREVAELSQQLKLAAGDLEKSMASIQLQSEGALRNFSMVQQDSVKTLMTLMDNRMSESSRASYDAIISATTAFGEDLNMLRNAVSSTASDLELLKGEEIKSVRALEDVRSGIRRHEANIKVLINEVGDFKTQTQDKLNHLRTHFVQTVNEFYTKIVDRQNQMSYRLTSVVDDLTSVKSKIRNFAGSSPASEGDNEEPKTDLTT